MTFYDTAQQAQTAGFRACKRCKPDQPRRRSRSTAGILDPTPPSASKSTSASATEQENVTSKIDRAVQLVQRSAAEAKILSLARLSEEVGLSKWHLLRVFRKDQGVTPREMADMLINGDEQQEARRSTQEQDMCAVAVARAPAVDSATLSTGERGPPSPPVQDYTGMDMDVDWCQGATDMFDGQYLAMPPLLPDEVTMNMVAGKDDWPDSLFQETCYERAVLGGFEDSIY